MIMTVTNPLETLAESVVKELKSETPVAKYSESYFSVFMKVLLHPMNNEIFLDKVRALVYPGNSKTMTYKNAVIKVLRLILKDLSITTEQLSSRLIKRQKYQETTFMKQIFDKLYDDKAI